MELPDRHGAQTTAQWAVRWHGLVLAAALTAAVPVFHLFWHGVLGRVDPPVVTRSQTTLPTATRAAVLDGSFARSLEVHLREASPIVWWWRGVWNEALFRCGFTQSRQVVIGRDGWLFLRATLEPDPVQFRRGEPARRRVFALVRDLVRQAGAELVVTLVPDKVTVYPEFAGATAAQLEVKASIRAGLHRELVDLGIAAVDLTAALQAAVPQAPPNDYLYYRRDSHWRPLGALVGGDVVAKAIEALPAAKALPPRRDAQLGACSSLDALGDLAPMLGLLSRELPDATGKLRTHPVSLLTGDYVERRDYYSAVLGGAVQESAISIAPDAPVLLIGTSFSRENGGGALALSLGRFVRAEVEPGAAGRSSLEKVMPELRAGTRAKVVVWEIVERGLLETDWETFRM